MAAYVQAPQTVPAVAAFSGQPLAAGAPLHVAPTLAAAAPTPAVASTVLPAGRTSHQAAYDWAVRQLAWLKVPTATGFYPRAAMPSFFSGKKGKAKKPAHTANELAKLPDVQPHSSATRGGNSVPAATAPVGTGPAVVQLL